MTNPGFTKKLISQGKSIGTRIDLLNRTGLGQFRWVSKTLKGTHGIAAKFGGRILGPAIVAWDTAKAYQDKGNVGRTLLGGAAGLGAGWGLGYLAGGSAALGGMAIGTLVGDAALGGFILLCSPILGWILLSVAGLALGVYFSEQIGHFVGDLWDDYGRSAWEKAASVADHLYDETCRAWTNGSDWVRHLI